MRILMLGDSPFLRTGFAVVNEQACRALKAEGHTVIVLGAQDMNTRQDPAICDVFIPVDSLIGDMLGWTKVDEIIKTHQIDAIHIIADPATATAWLIRDAVASLPVVAYIPIEGSPMNMRWTTVFRGASDLHLITCSEYGVGVLASEGFSSRMAYHGVSDDFVPADPISRDRMRKAIGWEDKFVVMMVAQNVRRKQWPRIFQAIGLLKNRYPNIILYAHTVPFNNFWLGGHDLPQLAKQIGVFEQVVFPPDHLEHNAFTPAWGTDSPGLVDLYNMADCFVLPSQVEGFGLPLAEAMKIGLPVATTNFAAQAEVVGDAGILLPVRDWEYNQSHSLHANVDPLDISYAIERFYRSPEMRRRYAVKGRERAARLFTWDKYKQTLVEEFDAINKRVLASARQGNESTSEGSGGVFKESSEKHEPKVSSKVEARRTRPRKTAKETS
jgi:glycosyltransferase involved in cell wall biosynthesis